MGYSKIAKGITINTDLLLYSFVQDDYDQVQEIRVPTVHFVFQAPRQNSGIQVLRVPVSELRYGYERDFGNNL